MEHAVTDRVVNDTFEKYRRYRYRYPKKGIADTDIDIEIEKYRRYRYRYSTNRYFWVDVNFTCDIRRLIGGISNR